MPSLRIMEHGCSVERRNDILTIPIRAQCIEMATNSELSTVRRSQVSALNSNKNEGNQRLVADCEVGRYPRNEFGKPDIATFSGKSVALGSRGFVKASIYTPVAPLSNSASPLSRKRPKLFKFKLTQKVRINRIFR